MRGFYTALFCAFVALSPAYAAHSITIDYSGVLASGSDGSGTWNTGSSSLSGQAFDLSFTYNLYLGGTTRSESGEGPIDDNDAYYYLAEDGPVTATLTINGVAISFEGAGQHSIYGDLLSFVKSQLHDQATNGSGLTVQANVFTCLLCLPVYAQIDTPFESVPGAQQTFAPSGFNFSTADVQTTGTFDITSFDLTAILPEPKTWALLLAGFGLVGMMLRGRQRRYSLR